MNNPRISHAVIDVPIGLPDHGPRDCDRAARALLPAKTSSVFTAPIRPVLRAATYAEANALRWAIEGKGMSKEGFGIVPLVRAVDQVMTPELQLRLREGHPELSFAMMAGGSPLRSKKKRSAGHDERLSLLEVHFPNVRAVVAALKSGDARVDAVDAYAMHWTARRWREGEAVVIPERPPFDPTGLPMEMIV